MKPSSGTLYDIHSLDDRYDLDVDELMAYFDS